MCATRYRPKSICRTPRFDTLHRNGANASGAYTMEVALYVYIYVYNYRNRLNVLLHHLYSLNIFVIFFILYDNWPCMNTI